MNLESCGLQPDLFGHAEIERIEKIYAGVDALSRKYGKHTVFLGSGFRAMKGEGKEPGNATTHGRQYSNPGIAEDVYLII